jgi:methionine-rich copper-binding protein CopC
MKTSKRHSGPGQTGAILFVLFLCALSGTALGHAYPDHADPKVGSTISHAPARVRIWFDSGLNPRNSIISVHDAKGNKIDRNDGRVSPADNTLLEVGVPPLAAGTYRVIWDVMSQEGHRTSGDYTFSVR